MIEYLLVKGDIFMNEAGQNLKFGQILRKIRKDRDLTIKDLAIMCDLSMIHISNLENNNRKVTMSVINKICNNVILTEEENQIMMDAFAHDRLDIPVELLYYLIDNDLIESLKTIKETDEKGINIKKLALKLESDKKNK